MADITVALSLSPEQVTRQTGIGQVVLAQWKYLPHYGIRLVSEGATQADVFTCHIQKPHAWPRIDCVHCHGLYWADVDHLPYKNWHHYANAGIIDSVRQAVAVTVPANWVGETFRRDMRLKPITIPHGIELDEFNPGTNGGYILYNKNRESDVCQSRPAWELAQAGHQVVSTFAPKGLPIPNIMQVTGTIPFDAMLKYIANADIYLGTTLETFGIGTIEALACGVPVLGYRWGGTAEIIKHGENGYLVDPGDVGGLNEGVQYIRTHRKQMGEAARESAKAYAWDKVIQQYAGLYLALAGYKPKNDVAVIITCYNYGRWVGEAIQSVLDQSTPPGELVVVDDGSTDNSREVIDSYRQVAASKGVAFQALFQSNQGVAAARNHGIAASNADFITCLDADDRIAPTFIQHLQGALAKDRGLGIAYGGLALINEKGEMGWVSEWPPEFDWELMATPNIPPFNCIPSACMYRREMWLRAGGYRQEYAPGEDTEFWVRGLATGFKAARVTRDPIFEYRGHEGSASRTRKYIAIDDKMPWMRTKEYPIGAPTTRTVTVKANYQPVVSVIIPVGPGHENYVSQALDSLLAQTIYEWEAIVINDTRLPFRLPAAYPFARIINNPGPKHGAGAARNLGLAAARAPLVLFLDADDLLMPTALEHMLNAFSLSDGKYIYTDWLAYNGSEVTAGRAKDFTRAEWRMFHPITILIPTQAAREIGFDEGLESWEDWDFILKCFVKGYCGQRVAEQQLIYRLDSGQRRMLVIDREGRTNERGNRTLAILKERYGQYYDGGAKMVPCQTCGGTPAAQSILRAKGVITRQMDDNLPSNEIPLNNTPVLIRLEYTGDRVGATTYMANGHSYRAGANPYDRYVDAVPDDARVLLSLGCFRQVHQPAQPMPAAPPPGQPMAVPKNEVQVAQDAQSTIQEARNEFEKLWETQQGAFDAPPIEVVDDKKTAPPPPAEHRTRRR